MANAFQFKRGTTTRRLTYTPLSGELVYDTTLNKMFIGDGITAGGIPLKTEADKLYTPRTIGGVAFDGTVNINLPGVNTTGNQSTSGNAATATKLATPRAINGTNFDGANAITVPVNVTTLATKGVDLNTFQTPGFYSCPSNATTATLLNCPTTMAFSLLVEKHAGIKQTITEYTTTGAKTYSRNFYSTWGAWYRVYTTIDPPTAVSNMAVEGYLTVNGSTNLAVLGPGTWIDMRASRALNTTFTNSSNKPIMLSIEFSYGWGSNPYINVSLDGRSPCPANVYTVVPPGSTYRVSSDGYNLTAWWERIQQ